MREQNLCELVQVGLVFPCGVDDHDVALRGVKVGDGQSLVFLKDDAVDQSEDWNHFAILALYLDYDR